MNNLNKLPSIKRARDFFLITENSKRILDLYRLNGKSLFGYKFGKMVHYTKNLLEQGVFVNYPSKYKNRAEKAVKSIFKNYNYIYFVSKSFDEKKLSNEFIDPLFSSQNTKFSYYRFFTNNIDTDTIIPIFPFYNLNFKVIVSKTPLDIESELFSPVTLGCATRIIYDMSKYLTKKIETKKIDFGIDFKQQGPYVTFNLSDKEYNAFFDRMLEKNILIAPSKNEPSILPFKFV